MLAWVIMPGHLPSLDREALQHLRELVKAMDRPGGRALPLDDLVRLAGEVRLDGGVTIDFEATRELGRPMVVVRVPAPPSSCLDGLTPREHDVTRLIADGLSNKQIARKLFISEATVKDHVHNILHKSGLPGRAAVAAAVLGHDPC